MAENPIKYSDLIQPDDSIDSLIRKLQELNGVYDEMQGKIISNAKQIAEALQKVNSTTEQGRTATVNAAKDAENLAEQNERLRTEQEALNRTIEESQRKLETLRQKQKQSTEDDIKARMEKAELLSTLKLQIKEQQAAEGSYDKLSAQYSLMKKRLNAMSEAERQSTKEGKALEEQAKKTYERMKELQEATGKHQLNVGNYPEISAFFEQYADRIGGAVTGNNQFASSLLNLSKSGAGAGSLFSSIGSGIATLGKSLLGLMANPVFLAIAGVAGIGAGIKWWWDYNSGLVEATRLTKQFTGKEGDDLKQYRNEVQAVADTFGKDFNEVLQSANSLSKQMGISADEALEDIKKGFIAGADVNGEYLDTLKEYPAYFKEAGISAEEFVAITAKGAQEGVFSDKAVDTIKEANLRLREMPTATQQAIDGIGLSSKAMMKALKDGEMTTFQAMQQISQRLSELPPQASEVGTAIADIFGGPGEDAGLQYLLTLKDINGNLDEMVAKGGETAKAQQELMESNLELENAIAEVFDSTDGFFETLSTQMSILWNDFLIAILGWLKDCKDGIIDLYNDFVDWYNGSEAVRISISTIFSTWKVGFKMLWSTIKTLGKSIWDIVQLLNPGNWFDPDAMKSTWDHLTTTIKSYGDDWYNAIYGAATDGVKAAQNRLEKINKDSGGKKKTNSGTPPKGKKPTGGGGNGGSGGGSSADNTEKEYQKRLKIQRDLEDSEVALIEDAEYRKMRAEELGYQRRIEDLRHYLATSKDLTDDEIETAENGIKLAQKNLGNMFKVEEGDLKDSLSTTADIAVKGVEDIQQQQDNIRQKRQVNDMYDLFGLNLNDSQKEAISTSMQYATQCLDDWMQKRVDAANSAVELANTEVQSNETLLAKEQEARENGLANSVEYAEQALAQSKATQRQALKQQEKAQKQQAAIQAVEQCNNLITATSQIWAGLGAFPPAAIAAIAVMWASFAASKIMAAKQTSTEQYGDGTVELLEGGSHASGNDISLGRKKDGTERRAEGGEFFAIINKRNSRKYRSIIPSVINSLNNGTFLSKYGESFNTERYDLSVGGTDMGRTNSLLNEIEVNTAKRTYQENGHTVTEYRNIKRISR